jgi:hypothetical protein
MPSLENHEGWGNQFVVLHEAAKAGRPRHSKRIVGASSPPLQKAQGPARRHSCDSVGGFAQLVAILNRRLKLRRVIVLTPGRLAFLPCNLLSRLSTAFVLRLRGLCICKQVHEISSIKSFGL